MPHELKKLIPNLVVTDVERSITFYRDVLGFVTETTVPDRPPLVFAALKLGAVQIFLNAPDAAYEEYPAFKGRPIGGTLTLYIEVSGVRERHDALKDQADIVMPLEKKWYGVTEFAISDPDGYLITFGERE